MERTDSKFGGDYFVPNSRPTVNPIEAPQEPSSNNADDDPFGTSQPQ